MTIKGTLETFNLRELLQMLAFNRKVGTLVLETEAGSRSIYVDQGRAGFVVGDKAVSETLRLVLLRYNVTDVDRLDRAFEIHQRSGRYLGEVLLEMGLLDEESLAAHHELVVGERLFDVQLSSINRFEFVDGKAIDPDGHPGTPIEPLFSVDALLLELTRKVDHWQVLSQTIPTVQEVFECTDATIALDTALEEDLDPDLVAQVTPRIDGCHSLQRISEQTGVDLFSVVQIAASMFEAGGLRPVPTEDLISRADDLIGRGQAEDALPLLRRGVDRGDAPLETRLRIADALEAVGDPGGAAVELDTFAALADDEKTAPAVFQALQRALMLRGGGDVPTACRLCDYYLRHRHWLRDHHKDAEGALRQLIQSALAQGRALDAASRLAAFIDAGEMPGSERLALADLYIAESQNRDAAEALTHRAEELLVAHRVPAARELLRRALDLDPNLADARRRIMEIDGAQRQRHQRRRVVFASILFLMIALGAGAAWWTYNQEASRAVNTARRAAEVEVDKAVRLSTGLLDAFDARVDQVETARTIEIDLAAEAKTTKGQVRAAITDVASVLDKYETELENYPASGEEESHRIVLRGLQHQTSAILSRVARLLRELEIRSTQALDRAENANAAGDFFVARDELLRARNLSFASPSVQTRADVLLRHVDDYIRRFEEQKQRMDAVREQGDFAGAFRIGVDIVIELLDSDLTRQLRFPMEVSSTPSGAEIFVGGESTGLFTPALIEYSPFEETGLRLRLPGHTYTTHQLPSPSDFQSAAETFTWDARYHGSLVKGPRFTIKSPGLPFARIWENGGLPVLLESDGGTTHGVDPLSGTLRHASALIGANPLRRAGTLKGGVEWQIRGQRTLRVQPPNGKAWETQAAGRLERAPTLQGDTLCVVDEVGNIYGVSATTGIERWRSNLGASPTQAPFASALGFLIATANGAAYRIHPERGTILPLAPAVRGTVFALPISDGALFVGGGTDGCRFIDHDGAIHAVGNASPRAGTKPCVCNEGVGWIDEDNILWVDAKSTSHAPEVLGGLGSGIERLSGCDGMAYGVSAGGELRAVSIAEPGRRVFSLQLGGVVTSDPLPLGQSVFILVDGDLLAVER